MIEVSPTSANPPETVSTVTVSPESTVSRGGIFASKYPQWTVAGVGPSLCDAMEVILLKFGRFSRPTPQDADRGPASPLRDRLGCLETQTVPTTERRVHRRLRAPVGGSALPAGWRDRAPAAAALSPAPAARGAARAPPTVRPSG